MRRIKSGLVEWGPEECTCTNCKDVWEVTKEDLTFWQIEEGQWDAYKVHVCGWSCPTCYTKNRIAALDNRAILLYNETVRRERDSRARADRIP